MFDLLPASPLTDARHRQLAPMPDADLFVLVKSGLSGYDIEDSVPISPGLGEKLSAAGTIGQTFHVADPEGEPYRLRRCGREHGHTMWRFQSLDHSRCRLMDRLRTALAPRLAAQVLHDLRNPMNALSLHADLLLRTIPKTDDPAQRLRAESSVQVIKSRLADLGMRQFNMVSLWLALAQPGSTLDELPEVTLTSVLENALQLMRGLYSLNNVMLRVENLDRITAGSRRLESDHFQLVLIALLVAACESAAKLQAQTREVLLQVHDGEDGGLVIQLGPIIDGTGLARNLGAYAHEGTLAALSLLLESDGIELSQEQPQAGIRLVIPPVPVKPG